MVESQEDLGGGRGTARDSLVVGGCTAVSRATGVVRVVVVGAVLGPTYFGNTFQLTNSLPNLIYTGSSRARCSPRCWCRRSCITSTAPTGHGAPGSAVASWAWPGP